MVPDGRYWVRITYAVLLDGLNMTLISSSLYLHILSSIRHLCVDTQLKLTETEKGTSSLPRRNDEDLKRSPGGQL